MLIDATHPEETRVVVVRGNRVEEFDYESASRKQLRGNIYLAKVARIEPSLQAAFVNYGGNRHGFLAFSEIHPDYYQIPVADREAMLREDAAERTARMRQEEAEFEQEANGAERPPAKRRRGGRRSAEAVQPSAESEQPDESNGTDAAPAAAAEGEAPAEGLSAAAPDADQPVIAAEAGGEAPGGESEASAAPELESAAEGEDADAKESAVRPLQAVLPPVLYSEFSEAVARGQEAADEIPAHEDDVETAPEVTSGKAEESDAAAIPTAEGPFGDTEFPEAVALRQGKLPEAGEAAADRTDECEGDANGNGNGNGDAAAEQQNGVVETVGSEDALEEVPQRQKRRWRQYKIQEVIKRNQIVLIQVVKEERGTKGAALTTYLSLAGRYTVLMPNTASGGGISRKITNPADRKRLKEIAQELEVPEGMGLIIRTAGASRTKAEIKRDFEYLLRLWENVRDLTLKSTAPALVYEEGDLIRRSIRDLYNKDIDEILVAGEDAYREAKDFMRMLMPSHAKNVQLYKDPEPLFTKYEVERQLNQMFSPVVTLKSGGYIVLNQTEALVAIDVNSGRATREYSIEDTALKTNLEAAEEIARQIRLRDLAGLIVIDFIDMDERRNNRAVERRLKECLRHDRARIQVGHISHFGLLEMSRQRLRQGVVEVSTVPCPMCQGVGTIRSTESVALMILRAIEDHLRTQGSANLAACCSFDAALYILNHKRAYLRDIERRYGVSIVINADHKMHGAHFTIERVSEATAPQTAEEPKAVFMDWAHHGAEEEGEDEAAGEDGQRQGRRRRRRGRGRSENGAYAEARGQQAEAGFEGEDERDEEAAEAEGEYAGEGEAAADEQATNDMSRARRHRRRGRRGGRRRRSFEQAAPAEGIPGLGEQPDVPMSFDEAQPQAAGDEAPAAAPVEAGAEQAEPTAQAAETPQAEAAPQAAEAEVPQPAVEPVVPAEPEPVAAAEEEGAAAAPQTEAPAEPARAPQAEDSAQPEQPAVPEPVSGALKLEIVSNGKVEPQPAEPREKEAPQPRPQRTGPVRRGWWQRRMS